jgi:Rad3-related DNA helicase
MSATISRKDIEALGLDRRRVLYLEADSPIPADRRPVHFEPVASVGRGNMQAATEQIAGWVEESLLDKYQGCKGVIHATYAQAKVLRSRWGGNERFIFHGKQDTAKRYKEFTDSSPGSGKILVASGMYEGLDLVDDLGRWQAIIKVPYPSLGDPAIRYKMEQDRDWYIWQALRQVMQGCGRICRRETDFGETYVLDGSFRNLYKQSLSSGLVPGWFRDVVKI